RFSRDWSSDVCSSDLRRTRTSSTRRPMRTRQADTDETEHSEGASLLVPRASQSLGADSPAPGYITLGSESEAGCAYCLRQKAHGYSLRQATEALAWRQAAMLIGPLGYALLRRLPRPFR